MSNDDIWSNNNNNQITGIMLQFPDMNDPSNPTKINGPW
jgi:5,10-methylene-tetrahydrofolate dehydrogenase/methenyl tetrahydrofolate cyclohydrolase